MFKKVIMSVSLVMFTLLTSFVVVSATNDVTYPFEKGDNAFKNGIKWTSPVEQTEDQWQFLEYKFDGGETKNLKDATHFAVQIKVDKGNPGFTIGLLENGDRYTTSIDNNTLYFIDKEGNKTDINVLYNSINLPLNKPGLLLLPMDQLNWQWNNNESTLENVSSLYITTNSLHNFDFEISIGEFGFYNVDPNNGGEYQSLRTLDNEPAVGQVYNGEANSSVDVIGKEVIEDKNIDYPFRKGEEAFLNGKNWKAPAVASAESNVQRLKIEFDQVVNLDEAAYLVIQMKNKTGAPGITYNLLNDDIPYGTAGSPDGSEIYYSNLEGLVKIATTTLYDSVTVNLGESALIIPMSSMDFGDLTGDLSEINALELSTDLKYNYNFEYIIGEIGYFTGEMEVDLEYHQLLNLNTDKSDKFKTSGDISNETELLDAIVREERTVYGDTIISFNAIGTRETDYSIWDGGSLGKVLMDVDSYGDTAVKLQANGTNPVGDSYTAITLKDGGNYSWANREGITMWARNDSDSEISFNIELDNRIVETGIGDRFNIQQGHRFYLYDINTNKTYIYMTKPVITLPVGFEGWIRVPFTAFNRADWSNNGVTKDDFMSEGTVVSYLAVTIHSTSYNYLPFTLNKVGAYQNDSSFISTFVKENADRLSILKQMELEMKGATK